MAESAIGLIETRGLVGVIEAADSAAKAADVQLLGIERVGGGFVSVRFSGDTASVQAAVRVAREAAGRVAEIVSAHVIPSPQIDIGALVAGGAKVAEGSGAAVVETNVTTPTPGELESLPVTRLRQLARQTPGLPLRGREISRANKQQLLEVLRPALGPTPGPADADTER